MIVKTLMENTSCSDAFCCGHGLSLYIETKEHKILFDTGPDGSFLKNAARMNVPITDVDTCIVSHGHSDHGGGLEAFVQANTKAQIFIHKDAFEKHISHSAPIPHDLSLDPALKSNPRIVLCDGFTRLAEGVLLFGVEKESVQRNSNSTLFKVQDGKEVLDDFSHELNLLIDEDGCSLLVCGCSHCGIVNIMDQAAQILRKDPDLCIGGFHLHNPKSLQAESREYLADLAGRLKKHSTQYYTCHCTGWNAYEVLKECMGSQIGYASAGTEIQHGQN